MGVRYIMESAGEVARLEGKTDAMVTEDQLRLCGLKASMAALDVGCGSGAVTRVMARITGPGTVVGIDQSAARLVEARAIAVDNGVTVEFIPGDATSLPLPSGQFDFTWSRFLFEYLENPRAALTEMIRVTRAGGIVVVGDLDGQISQFFPLPAALQSGLSEGLARLAETGFDPLIGRKLYTMFHEAGLRDIEVSAIPYQVYAGGVPAKELSNWTAKLTTVAALLGERTGDPERWSRFRDDFLSHVQRPEVFYYCTLLLVRGRV